MGQLHFLFLFLLGGDQNLVFDNFLFNLPDLVFNDDQFTIRLRLTLLQLVDVVFQLHDDFLELICLVVVFASDSLDAQLRKLLVMLLNLLQLIVIDPCVRLELQSLHVEFKRAQLVLSVPCLTLLGQEELAELARFCAVALHELLDKLFIAAVHSIEIVLLLCGESFALPIQRFHNLRLDVFIDALNRGIGLPQIRLFVLALESLLADFVIFLLENDLGVEGHLLSLQLKLEDFLLERVNFLFLFV